MADRPPRRRSTPKRRDLGRQPRTWQGWLLTLLGAAILGAVIMAAVLVVVVTLIDRAVKP